MCIGCKWLTGARGVLIERSPSRTPPLRGRPLGRRQRLSRRAAASRRIGWDERPRCMYGRRGRRRHGPCRAGEAAVGARPGGSLRQSAPTAASGAAASCMITTPSAIPRGGSVWSRPRHSQCWGHFRHPRRQRPVRPPAQTGPATCRSSRSRRSTTARGPPCRALSRVGTPWRVDEHDSSRLDLGKVQRLRAGYRVWSCCR